MKIVCYSEPTENGLLLHYPSSSVKAELLHLGYLIDETIQLCAELGIVIEPIK